MSLTEEEIRRALMEAGAILPTTERAVVALDNKGAPPSVPLPASLSADRLLASFKARPTPKNVARVTISMAAQSEGLARAARNGEQLPPEIEAQMASDRKRIEGSLG